MWWSGGLLQIRPGMIDLNPLRPRSSTVSERWSEWWVWVGWGGGHEYNLDLTHLVLSLSASWFELMTWGLLLMLGFPGGRLVELRLR